MKWRRNGDKGRYTNMRMEEEKGSGKRRKGNGSEAKDRDAGKKGPLKKGGTASWCGRDAEDERMVNVIFRVTGRQKF